MGSRSLVDKVKYEGNDTASGLQTLASSSHLAVPRAHTITKNAADSMVVDDHGSDLPKGDDLRQDLENALDDSNFSFTGNFYHANILTTAPNPCLHILGLGFIGLPLDERDAKAIVSNATLSPFGHGERTVVDKDVRDTWEIEPDRITFGNPEWLKYIDGVVCLEVCKALGVAIGNPSPKMELYKLLLYEKGSHFLPHQDTQKAVGMFATVVILLPSAYTGGHIVVSHASTTKTIDLAPNSLLSTAVLAWYTDVKHEVKPVTSGYRLALTYNLIHTPIGVPQPTMPQMGDSVDKLRRVLTKWRQNIYTKAPEMPLLAYVLRHEYSAKNLKDGFKALKGADAHLVVSLRGVAEELEYMVGLATLERHVSGPGDDLGDSYHRRSRHDYYSGYEDEDDDTPEMLEVTKRTTGIAGLVDLAGVSLLSSGKIQLEAGNLVPSDPFENKAPNKVEYEGYMGNGAGDVTHWYHRTVLVLIHEKDLDHAGFSDAGISYAFQKLAGLGAEYSLLPSADMKIWGDRIVSKSDRLNKKQVLKMLDLATIWKDMGMFKTIMQSRLCTLSVVGTEVLSKAWKIFSFIEVRSCFEQALDRSPGLSEKMNFIYEVRSATSIEDKPEVDPWCKDQANKVLASYTQPDVKDVPVIMNVICQSGWSPFVEILFPNILRVPESYSFLIALIKALQEARQSLLDRLAKVTAISQSKTYPKTEPGAQTEAAVTKQECPEDGKDIVDKVIEQALEVAAKQWSLARPPMASLRTYYASYHPIARVARTDKVDRIIEIVDQTILSGNLEICRTLFSDVLQSSGTFSEKLTQLYDPLTPRLSNLLQSKSFDICIPPFVDLFRKLIAVYLQNVLGKKGQHLNPRLRKIGCGCEVCQPLDTFILDPTTRTTLFRLAQRRRTHLEGRISTAPDLCSYETIRSGNPHGVQITKRPEVVQASRWDQRQKAARTFLSSIGTEEVIKKIMGERYTDVVGAINGSTPFSATEVSGDGFLVSTANVATTSAACRPTVDAASQSGTLIGASMQARPALASSVPPQVAGQKRKDNPVVNLGFIDLT